MRLFLRLILWPILALGGVTVSGASPTPAPAASPAPTPIPISQIVSEADKTSATLLEMRAALEGDGISDNVGKYLPQLKQQIDTADGETAKLLSGTTKLAAIQEEISRWNLLRDQAGLWTDLLSEKLSHLEQQVQQLTALDDLWKATQAEAVAAKMPPDLLTRLTTLRGQIATVEKEADAKRTELLRHQGRLADESARISQTLSALGAAREAAVGRLFLRDSAPLWMALAPEATPDAAGREALTLQFDQIGRYLFRERGKVVLNLVLWAFLVSVFVRAQRRVRKWTESEPALKDTMEVFEVPLSAATLLALCASFLLFPAAPHLLNTLLGAALVLPIFVVLRHLIDRPLLPITWALLGLYLGAQAREVAAALPHVSRLIFLAEAAAGMIFVHWLVRRSRFASRPEKGRRLLWNIVGIAARAAFLVFAAVAALNILGYVSLALFIGYTALKCAYLGILLYAACRILDGVLTFLFNVPPLSLLAIVRHHRTLLERRIMRVIRLVAAVIWVAFALEKLSLLNETVAAVKSLLALSLVAGVTVGGVLSFLLAVWASFLISRFVRFVLEEDVYRRVTLKPGIPFAISTLLHYAILLLGFYIAMAALMGDISKFTVLAGAFGVGIGFGLQNIVNNFVSSLIVLFERPVKIGDHIEIGPLQGTVRQIGIRATVISTAEGSEIIIPNAKLISDPVTNWTLTARQRLVELEVTTVAPGVDPQTVIALLEKTASDRSAISRNPPPRAVLVKFTAAALTFRLSVWITDLSSLERLRSDLAVAVSEALSRAGIAAA
jgi:Small-conductance mechanosensitive channel